MANIGYLQVVRICNQKCRFCSNPDNENILDIEQGRAALDDMAARRYTGVFFTGGEPLLYEALPELVRHATELGLTARLITNGQKLGDGDLLEQLQAAGLTRINLSLHSARADVQDFLTGNTGSFENIARGMRKAAELRVPIDINTTINAYNADHLDETVKWLLENHPEVRHVVWNNMDPTSDRVEQNPDVIPKMRALEISLLKAMRLLHRSGRTFRVERVPLCYMVEFAHCSTETRKIVKDEERLVHFLDQKGAVHQTKFDRDKADCCKVCLLNPVCAGLQGMGQYYDGAELYPVFVPAADVARRVLEGDAGDGYVPQNC